MHPDHDLSLGEAYYKDIYEALRASPSWNETLLVITFDEHGGFYDRASARAAERSGCLKRAPDERRRRCWPGADVPTPLEGVPSPDNSSSFPDFAFHWNRFGSRGRSRPTDALADWAFAYPPS